MNNAEFDRLEKVLVDILKELQIQNKLKALEMGRLICSDKKEIELTLKGHCLKSMMEYERNE